MKIEKLAEDKIKITITIDDLAERNIDLYSFMYNSPESQDLFWDVMSEAEKEYGFNVDDSMIYVEASTSGGGNFTLIVTKTKEKPIVKLSTSKPAPNKENIKLKRKKIPAFLKDGLYKFASFEDVCSFCSSIDVREIVDSTLYRLDDTYYLKASIIPATLILEYASIVKYPLLVEARILEHGNVVIEKNAVETINQFLDYIKIRKVVSLEDISGTFKLNPNDIVMKLNQYEKEGRIMGIIDDRGKYIYITEKEMGLIEKMLMNRGRISKTDLIKECNRLIRFEPTEQDKIKIAEEQEKTLKELEDELKTKK